MFLSFHLVLLIGCAVVWFKAAEIEHASTILWTGLSVLVFLATWLALGWGLLGCLGGQVVLLGGVTLVRFLRPHND